MGARRRPDIRVATLISAALFGMVVLLPFLIDDRFTLKILTFVGINVIIVSGLALLFGYAGQISLGHAAFFGIGAYTSAILTTSAGMPWSVGVVAGTVLAAFGGLLLAIPSLRLKGHYLAMATLGFGEIMVVLFVEMRGLTGGPDGMSGIPAASIGSFEFTEPWMNYLLVWIVAGVAVLLAANLRDMRPGRALRALHGSESGVQACGVDVRRLKLQVFTVSAGVAGLAGAFYAHFVRFISPSSFSLELSIMLVAMVVIGGTGSLAGAVAGAVGLTLLPFIDAIIPGIPREVAMFLQDWEHDIYGLAIILVMLFLPQGIAGGLRGLTRRMVARRAGSEGEVS